MCTYDELFKAKKIHGNFSYLSEIKVDDETIKREMAALYKEINVTLGVYKVRYKEFARSLRGLWIKVLNFTLKVMGKTVPIKDNIQDKLSKICNDVYTDEKVGKFVINLLGINKRETLNRRRPFYIDHIRQDFHETKSFSWRLSGDVSSTRIINNLIFDSNETNFLNSFKTICGNQASNEGFLSLLKDFTLTNIHQSFISYVVHDEPEINVTDEDVEETLSRMQDVYIYFMHSLNFMNHFLSTLFFVYYGKINISKNYPINPDYFNINENMILNVYHDIKNNEKLLFAYSKTMDNTFSYSLIKEQYGKINQKQLKMYDNIKSTCAKMEEKNALFIICSGEEIYAPNENAASYYLLFQYKLGGTGKYFPLTKRVLEGLSKDEKFAIIDAIIDGFKKLHKSHIFLRYIDEKSYVLVIDEDDDDNKLFPRLIKLDLAKKDRTYENNTVKDLVVNVFYDGDLTDLLRMVDVSDEIVSSNLDALNLISLFVYILSDGAEESFNKALKGLYSIFNQNDKPLTRDAAEKLSNLKDEIKDNIENTDYFNKTIEVIKECL